MIEELQVLKDILGDLSHVGGWVAAGYIIYQLLVNMTMLIGGGWLLKMLIERVSAHMKTDITREEADRIKNDAAYAKRDHIEHCASKDAEITKLNSEVERVKHMYKILKEVKEHASQSTNDESPDGTSAVDG